MKIWHSVVFLMLEGGILTYLHICYVNTRVILGLPDVSDDSRSTMLSIMAGQYDAWKGFGYIILFFYLCAIGIWFFTKNTRLNRRFSSLSRHDKI